VRDASRTATPAGVPVGTMRRRYLGEHVDWGTRASAAGRPTVNSGGRSPAGTADNEAISDDGDAAWLTSETINNA
jgi:hypothetical protein